MNSKSKAEHTNWQHLPFRRKMILFVGGLIVIGCLAFGVKPIRRIILTYSIKVLSRLNPQTADETPNLSYDELDIKVVDKDSEGGSYCFVTETPEDVHKGNLILVDTSNACRFLEQDRLINIAKNKNRSFKVMDKKMELAKPMMSALNEMMKEFERVTGKHDMIITSAYRSLKEQNEALQEKISEFGERDALKWAMLPGYSEHHTGYAVDMSIRTDDDVDIRYSGQSEYAWINQNCFKYGIIRRYTEDKANITGISNEPWHYRYVGIPHAYLMTIKNFSLEEYIDYIRQFTFEKQHLKLSTDKGDYEIYYIPAAKEEDTLVPVPKNKPYLISGNNIDGFIVTVYL